MDLNLKESKQCRRESLSLAGTRYTGRRALCKMPRRRTVLSKGNRVLVRFKAYDEGSGFMLRITGNSLFSLMYAQPVVLASVLFQLYPFKILDVFIVADGFRDDAFI